MYHFLYLVVFAVFTAVIFAIVSNVATTKEKIIVGAKAFAEFLGIAFVLAWVLYFLPW